MPPAAAAAATAGANTGNANTTWRRNNNNNNNNTVTPVSFSAAASSSQHPPFFLGAPITKLLTMIWALGSFWIIRTSVGSSDREYQDYIYQNNNANSVSLLFWNTVKSCFFVSSSEAVVGLAFLANYMRRLERELSSRRFVVWWMTVEAVFVTSQLVAMATLDSEVAYGFSSQVRGPYRIIGGVLYWYWMYVPRLHPRFLSLPMLGMNFSEKSFGFFWAAYVLFMAGTASLLVGGAGFLGSALFFFLLMLPSAASASGTNSGNHRGQLLSMDLPDRVANMLPWNSLGSILLLDSPPKVFAPLLLMNAGRNNNLDMALGAGLAVRRQPRPARPQPTAPPAPSPEAIAQLVSMGFDEQRVKEALEATGNNIERAADRLLTG
jgi:UBA/TS-N domain